MRGLHSGDLPRVRVAVGVGGRTRCWLTILLAAVLCGSCGFKGQQKAIGYAYTGPSALNLRNDLGVRATTTATVEHGERLEILENRRRFVRVRTTQGVEGWTDSTYLLTQSQMDDLNRLAARAAEMPSQGAGTVFDTLNVHTAASRTSASFAQIEEGAKLDVVAHRVTDRELPGGGKSAEDWFLVRTHEGRAGWVLSRMVLMTIPDEVAQYANGHYITAYHSLGEGKWLWTTSARSRQPFDFDGIRVFVYNEKRKAFDTVFSETNVRGFYPVTQSGDAFSAVVEEKDGSLMRRTYSFNGAKVKLQSREVYQPPPPLPEVEVPKTFDTTAPKDSNWADRARGVAEWWFGF
ncbi:MAG: SH3 domain-containing protein [Bryobacteraceae bacterium]